jgi:hypothetical protein
MPKPNYSFQKRQRELAKKDKKAEKERRKLLPPGTQEGAEGSEAQGDAASSEPPLEKPPE